MLSPSLILLISLGALIVLLLMVVGVMKIIEKVRVGKIMQQYPGVLTEDEAQAYYKIENYAEFSQMGENAQKKIKDYKAKQAQPNPPAAAPVAEAAAVPASAS